MSVDGHVRGAGNCPAAHRRTGQAVPSVRMMRRADQAVSAGSTDVVRPEGDLLLQQPVATLELAQLSRLRRRRTGANPVLDIGSMQPVAQARVGDPEVLGDLDDWSVPTPGHGHDVRAELLRMRSRHDRHPSSEGSRPHRSGVNQTFSSPSFSSLTTGSGTLTTASARGRAAIAPDGVALSGGRPVPVERPRMPGRKIGAVLGWSFRVWGRLAPLRRQDQRSALGGSVGWRDPMARGAASSGIAGSRSIACCQRRLGEQVPVEVHRHRRRRVAEDDLDCLHVGAGGDEQRRGGVPQIMDRCPLDPCGPGRVHPARPRPEVGVGPDPAGRAREQIPTRCRCRDPLAHVPVQRRWHRHRPRLVRLGRPEHRPTRALGPRRRPVHPHPQIAVPAPVPFKIGARLSQPGGRTAL